LPRFIAIFYGTLAIMGLIPVLNTLFGLTPLLVTISGSMPRLLRQPRIMAGRTPYATIDSLQREPRRKGITMRRCTNEAD
jgi:hypothetical protein